MDQSHDLFAALLDSWDRNNRIVVGLLDVMSPEALFARATPDGPSVGGMFAHIHSVRLDFVAEDAPEFARPLPAEEWAENLTREELAANLGQSAAAVREAVAGRVEQGKPMEQHFDHPVLLLQHLIWHEGYHHGQIKLTLKLNGMPLSDEVAGPASWQIWMKKSQRP